MRHLPDDDACDFISEVQFIIDLWRERPLLADHDDDAVVARLRCLAADMIRLVDSAEARGWDTRDVAYRVNEQRDIDFLLALPPEELDERFDEALTIDRATWPTQQG